MALRTIYTKQMVNVKIKFDIICKKCGCDLISDTTVDEDGMNIYHVYPCNCVTKKENK